MPLSWITPKTDWDNTSKFTYADYNRIRNNLLYINEKLNEMYPDVAVELDLGNPKTGYADKYYPSEFNAFEDALESFTRVGLNVNIGDKKTFKGNDPFILSDELNRIEKCSLRWKEAHPVVKSATLTPDRFTIKVDETIKLTLTVVPSNAPYSVVWSSSDTSKAIVSDGVVTGKGNGSATITATIKQNGQADIVLTSVCVVEVNITSISISPNKASLTWDEEMNYTVNIQPPSAAGAYTVASSDERIVSAYTGHVTAGWNAGNARVTVSAGGLSSSMDVQVLLTPLVFNAGAVVLNNELHILGGGRGGGDTEYRHAKYNGETWTDVSILPFRARACAVLNNVIHIFGGTNHYMWNGTTWVSVSTIPFNCELSRAVTLGNEIHLIGRDLNDKWKSKHYKWNGSSWSQVSVMPIYNGESGLVVYNNQIHVFYNTYKRHYSFNGTSWDLIDEFEVPNKNYMIYGVAKGKIHMLGGCEGTTFNEPENMRRHYTWSGSTWQSSSTLKYPTGTGSGDGIAIEFKNQLYCLDCGYFASTDYSPNNAHNMFIVDT